MRIGIYFRETAAEGGGAHTFESAVCEAILTSRRARQHDLVFMGPESSCFNRARKAGQAVLRVPITGVPRAWVRLPRPQSAVARALRQRSRRVRIATGLDRLIDRSGVDMVWCLGPDVPSLETPFFMTVWDLQHRAQPFFPEVSADGIWRRRERYFATTLRRATKVIVGTHVGKEEVMHFYGVNPDRIVVLPHPTPPLPEVRDDRLVLERLRVEPGFLLYPAQFWPHKNHVTLLRALQLLIREGSGETLVLVGSDWGRNEAFVRDQISQLGLTSHVSMLGFVSSAELGCLYRSAKALVYPSLFGPENLPPLEAFSQGCPVIAARVAGAEEQLGDAAILVDALDPEGLASAIRSVEVEDRRNQLITRGRARAEDWTPREFVEGVFDEVERFEPIRRNWGAKSWPQPN